VYFHWASINADAWRLEPDQAQSAQKVLERADGIDIEIIPTRTEDGISIIAFALKDVVAGFGEGIAELAMDSTCKFL
jgi:hypothetical protein